jgi:small subunit ribosomal protein S20
VANTASAQQRIRNSARKAVFNRLHRSRARTFTKGTEEALAKKDVAGAQTELAKAISAIDKAAGKGVMHKNRAARQKSRLMKAVAQAATKAK